MKIHKYAEYLDIDLDDSDATCGEKNVHHGCHKWKCVTCKKCLKKRDSRQEKK